MKCRIFTLLPAALLIAWQANGIDSLTNVVARPDATSIRLTWTPYANSSIIREYRVLRNDASAGSTIGKYGYFTDSGLTHGTSYAYRVQGLDVNGTVICESASVRTSTLIQTTIRTEYNVLALVFNPNGILDGQLEHIKTFLKFRFDVMSYASHGSANLHLYNNDIVEIRSYPPLLQNSNQVDYWRLTRRNYSELGGNNMVDLIERYDADMVWVIDPPQGYEFGRNILIGNKGLGNGLLSSVKVKSSRSFFVQFTTSDARALGTVAHHVEDVMKAATTANPTTWPRDMQFLVYTSDQSDYSKYLRSLNLFERFCLTDEWNSSDFFASKGNANCGSSEHLPGALRSATTYPNYTFYDVKAWKRYVNSSADDWLSYPRFSDSARVVNGYEYGAFDDYHLYNTSKSFAFSTASYHLWWLNHIPHNSGVSEGKLNNWWPYILDCNRFDGKRIDYAVDGFPVIPTKYTPQNNREFGTDDSDANLWAFWQSSCDFGQRADLTMVDDAQNPDDVANGHRALKVVIDIESWANGRNDLIYPRYKNATWDFTNVDSVSFSVKFVDEPYSLTGTNPILRICTNGGTRLEYVPVVDGLYSNLFNYYSSMDEKGWYNFSVPIRGSSSWERNLVTYIDSTLTQSEQVRSREEIVKDLLSGVNYIELSIQTDIGIDDSFTYLIDNLQFHDRTQFPPLSIASFDLLNERTGQLVRNFTDSIKIDRADPDFRQWVIRANTVPSTVGSVSFRVDNKWKFIDNSQPYYAMRPFLFKRGNHQLTAQAYSVRNARGDKGRIRSAAISVIDSRDLHHGCSSAAGLEVSLYPVPADLQLFAIFTQDVSERFHIQIRNIQGRVMHKSVYSTTELANEGMSTAGWQPGLYVCEIRGTSTNFLRVIRFLKR